MGFGGELGYVCNSLSYKCQKKSKVVKDQLHRRQYKPIKFLATGKHYR